VRKLSKTYFLENINEELQREFKTACAHYGKSMREVLMSYMISFVYIYQTDESRLDKPKTDKHEKGTK